MLHVDAYFLTTNITETREALAFAANPTIQPVSPL